MRVEGFDEHWLSLKILSEEVFVILGILSTKLVRLIFIIVGFQVTDNFRSHMGMIWTWSNARVQHGSHVFVTLSCNQPAREDDEGEVCQYQEPSLFARLDLERMQMHMELGPNVGVKNSIDVFKVDSSGLFVRGVWQRIRFVEPTSHSLQAFES